MNDFFPYALCVPFVVRFEFGILKPNSNLNALQWLISSTLPDQPKEYLQRSEIKICDALFIFS